jgi:hypothetical protein
MRLAFLLFVAACSANPSPKMVVQPVDACDQGDCPRTLYEAKKRALERCKTAKSDAIGEGGYAMSRCDGRVLVQKARDAPRAYPPVRERAPHGRVQARGHAAVALHRATDRRAALPVGGLVLAQRCTVTGSLLSALLPLPSWPAPF